MTWFKVDDSFAFHPKAIAAGNAALGLWVRAGSWSAQQLTDGFVPASVLVTFGAKPKDAAALVDASLWLAVDGGWLFHDWDDYQPSRGAVEAKRADARGRMQRVREQKRSREQPANVRANNDERSREVRSTQRSPYPDPTRPEPEHPDGCSTVATLPRRGDEALERADVEGLCNRLADRIVANGSKRPSVTKAWRDAARLMLDRDGRTPEQIAAAIDWCQADDFWRSNVLSMPKLREKYDQLRLQAGRRNGSNGAGPARSTTDERVAQGLALVQKYEAMEREQLAIEGAP